MANPFHFKQFTLQQDRCAMKIGTDGVLLGAWTQLIHQPRSVLDVGAGTGIIALQLAQRSNAELIDAVEIDEDAFEQCTENFESSPWGDRLFCYHASLQEFASEMEEPYELIVSNPPFFSEDVKSGDPTRDTARFEDSLPFEHLLPCVAHLLSANGVFATVLPKNQQDRFIALAQNAGLFLNRICFVKGTPDSEIKRVLMEFSFEQKPTIEESLTLELSRHEYTPEYISLVRDFYFKM